MSAPEAHDPTPSRGEELANCLSHAMGLVAALVAVPFLIALAVQKGQSWFLVGASVFAASVVLLYAGSTLYHALPAGRAKSAFRVLDHCAIYLLIAGTYTPFALGPLRDLWGGTLIGVVWTFAAVGVVFEIVDRRRHPRLSLVLYLAMGWLAVGAIRPLWLSLAPAGFFWLIAGGLAYTVGARFYAHKSLPYGHFVWHLFVLTGTACHFVAVLYAA
ncbi:MAG: hemolysin III family protein [Vicinamibacteria bacterium]|nr:hemolysin III family protein [Vicinamibacteria bacterium]